MDIHLNFVNRSNDTNNSNIVIFQKNESGDAHDVAIAWTVIRNCGPGSHHPFVYPVMTGIGYGDSDGNYTAEMLATPGMSFVAERTTSGDIIRPLGKARDPAVVELVNSLPHGMIEAQIYKANRVIIHQTGIAPGQTAGFQLAPSLSVAVVSQVEQGEVMNSAIVSTANFEFALIGIASADLVMTGGGAGPKATPFSFALENVVTA